MLQVQSPVQPADTSTAFSLWNLGFRPFYFLASVFASLSILLWSLEYAGLLPVSYLRAPVWHAHEMLFGFALAVIAGFLFTAVRNWTGQATPTGPLLGAYAALWVAGRILVLTQYALAAALVNALFPLAVAVGIGVPLARSKNRRNYFFVALLIGLGVAELAGHLSALQTFAMPELVGVRIGLDLVLFIMAVMGGRVIPMFTNNGIPGANAERRVFVERLALGGVLALLLADLLAAGTTATAVLALAVAAAHLLRLSLWKPWRTGPAPLVWILHLGYGWIVVHLVLRAAAGFGYVPETLALHALTIGAIGGLTIGMMTRTARGHTGRVLSADRYEVTCFVLVQLAAAIRVLGGMVWPQIYVKTVVASAICWSCAFALYAIRYWPVLSRARVDGKSG